MEEETGFTTGQHVVAELDDTTIAGHLLGKTDDGWVLKVTHKTKVIPAALPDGAEEEIAGILEENATWRLRMFMLQNRVAGALRMSREEMVSAGVTLIRGDLLKDVADTHILKEMLSPVTTFVSNDIVRTMEVTDDRNMDALLSNLDFEPELDLEDGDNDEDSAEAPTGAE
ncbi:hypothetical protein PBI_MIMI_277 [Arthrobacter phage Mimi]|nr:hypothetical protein PBI_MIMI_71 [Arthrobacter phage Mimi]